MSPEEALTTVLKQSPKGVIILVEDPNGTLSFITGPDMSLEHINFVLDQAKHYIVSRGLGPTVVPAPPSGDQS